MGTIDFGFLRTLVNETPARSLAEETAKMRAQLRLDELERTTTPPPDPAVEVALRIDARVEKVLADPEAVEMWRANAWVEAPDAMDRIHAGLPFVREGWPDGVDPATWIRKGVEPFEQPDAPPAEPAPEKNSLRALLDG